jgi:hypothetical protein
VCASVCIWNVLSVCVMRLVCRPGVSLKILNCRVKTKAREKTIAYGRLARQARAPRQPTQPPCSIACRPSQSPSVYTRTGTGWGDCTSRTSPSRIELTIDRPTHVRARACPCVHAFICVPRSNIACLRRQPAMCRLPAHPHPWNHIHTERLQTKALTSPTHPSPEPIPV